MERDVDIVVGAQYGDEGKGMVSVLLADRQQKFDPYAWVGRVGAQNAEHRFIRQGCELTSRILPSASARRWDVLSVLGPGHCFNPGDLEKEAVHLGVKLSSVVVSPNAMMLTSCHREQQKVAAGVRGSTGWGVGAALAEKVKRHPGTKLMEGVFRGTPVYEVNVPRYLNDGGFGLIEGTQGALLSLDHSENYPHCTGKNVTAPAILAEMGLSAKRLRYVFGVVRLVPMRTPGNSGDARGEKITFDEIEARTGLRIPQHRRLQGDCARYDCDSPEERLFEFSLEELEYSHMLNGYDFLVVTFADYHRRGNYRATNYDNLHNETKDLIVEISKKIAPVILIRTGQGELDNIWLRHPDEPL